MFQVTSTPAADHVWCQVAVCVASSEMLTASNVAARLRSNTVASTTKSPLDHCLAVSRMTAKASGKMSVRMDSSLSSKSFSACSSCLYRLSFSAKFSVNSICCLRSSMMPCSGLPPSFKRSLKSAVLSLKPCAVMPLMAASAAWIFSMKGLISLMSLSDLSPRSFLSRF